jgi:hypothetical protein
LITPILSTKNPYNAAKIFESLGWNIDFMTPPESDDPICQVSLHGNSVLLGTMEEKYVQKEAIPFVGVGIELHLTVPAADIAKVYENHMKADPSRLMKQAWGETAFHVVIEGYKFLMAAEG